MNTRTLKATFIVLVTGLLLTLFAASVLAYPPDPPRPLVKIPLSGERVNLYPNPVPARPLLAAEAASAVSNDDISLVLDDGSLESVIGVVSGPVSLLFLNRFTPAPDDFPFLLDKVQIYHASFGGATGVSVGDRIDLVFFEDTDGDGDPSNAALLATVPETIGVVDTFALYDLASPVRFDGPGDVLIGFVYHIPAGAPETFPGALDNNNSQRRSWVGIWGSNPPDPITLPATNLWGLMDDIGFPGNWMIRAFGRSASLPGTRFRGSVYDGPRADHSQPMAGVTMNLYARNQEQAEPGTLIRSAQTQLSGFFNFLLPVSPPYEYFTLMAETPAGMEAIAVWSEDGTVVDNATVQWRMPAAEVHENEFYLETPVSAPTEILTDTVDLPLQADTWVTWGDQDANYDGYQALILRPSGLDNVFLKFDRSALPQKATILDAELNVQVNGQTGAAGKTMTALNVDVFTPKQVTYAKTPAVYNPGPAVEVPDGPGPLAFDVTTQVAMWDAPAFTSYHWGYLAISASGPNGRIILDSLEAPAGTPAILSVTYTTAP